MEQLMSDLICTAHKVLHVRNHRLHEGAQWQSASTLGIAVMQGFRSLSITKCFASTMAFFSLMQSCMAAFRAKALGTR